MKRIYKQRREALVNSLKEHFPDCEIVGHAAGMHLVVELKSIEFHTRLVEWIKENSIQIYPVDYYSILKGNHGNKIVMGYGSLTIDRIEEGVRRFKRAVDRYEE